MSEKEPEDYRSGCGQILFHYGKGYGLTDVLPNTCPGNEEDIKRFLETGGPDTKLSNAAEKAQDWFLV